MSAHTMQSTLRLLIVGQAPIEPWKLVGEPPRGVSRATSLRSLTSMRLTPCPVALPRSWLASAAAGVTIGVEIRFTARSSSSTPSTRRLLDGVAVAVLHPTHWLISTGDDRRARGGGAPAPRPHVSVKRAGRRGTNSCEGTRLTSAVPRARRRDDPARRVNKSAKTPGPAAAAVRVEPRRARAEAPPAGGLDGPIRCLRWHRGPCMERHVYLASPIPLGVSRSVSRDACPVSPGRANS
jgi:hypothetical protein